MKHPSNRDLFAHWNARRGERLAPDRSDIDPAVIRQGLGDTFVLATGARQHPFRLAGTRLCAMFGRELKGSDFGGLWDKCNQVALRELLAVVDEEKVGIVASVVGVVAADGNLSVPLEMVLLPLSPHPGVDARVIGALAPMAAPYWLGVKVLGPLELTSFQHIGPALRAVPSPRTVPEPGRTRHGLVVYQGGRAD